MKRLDEWVKEKRNEAKRNFDRNAGLIDDSMVHRYLAGGGSVMSKMRKEKVEDYMGDKVDEPFGFNHRVDSVISARDVWKYSTPDVGLTKSDIDNIYRKMYEKESNERIQPGVKGGFMNESMLQGLAESIVRGNISTLELSSHVEELRLILKVAEFVDKKPAFQLSAESVAQCRTLEDVFNLITISSM